MSETAVLLAVIRAAGRARVPVLLWSTPGTGKSELVETLGRLDGLHTEVVIGSLREPADLNGLPVVQPDGSVVMAPPRWAQNLVDADGGYLFLDELSTAAPSVQAAMLRVAKDRVVGDLALPPGTRIVAAANPVDAAAGGWELAAPTANRFLHLDHRPEFDAWVEGLSVGFDAVTAAHDHIPLTDGTPRQLARETATVSGFLRARAGRWNQCPTDPDAAGRAWPSPRTWDYLRRVLSFLPADAHDARGAAARGLVGEAAGMELLTWARHSDLPDPADVLDGNVVFVPDDRDDRVFAVLSGVAAVAAHRGTTDAWLRAWDILRLARLDLAAVAARSLFRSRPADAPVPDAVLDFEPLLRHAGMLA